jgi:predicted dehydrogenase
MIRLGLLTTANINRAILDARYEGAPYSVDAVGSRNLDRARAYAAEHALARAHGSYEELLADPELDAVYIALPNALHHEWTLRALAAGKHVLCEKPYTRRPQDVDEAWDEAGRRGLVVMEAFMWRHSPQTRKLLALLPRIGELQAIRASFSFALTREVDVRLDRDLGGGSLLDVGCYCVSAARLVAGREPDRVYAEQWTGRGGVDERFAAVLRFGHVPATFHSGFTAFRQGLEAVGTEGVVVVPDPFTHPTGIVVLNGEERRVDTTSAYRFQLENFAAAIAGEEPPLLGRDDALGQARTLDALLQSAESGQAVDL